MARALLAFLLVSLAVATPSCTETVRPPASPPSQLPERCSAAEAHPCFTQKQLRLSMLPRWVRARGCIPEGDEGGVPTTLELQLEFDATGRVTAAKIQAASPLDPPLKKCIEDAFKGMSVNGGACLEPFLCTGTYTHKLGRPAAGGDPYSE